MPPPVLSWRTNQCFWQLELRASLFCVSWPSKVSNFTRKEILHIASKSVGGVSVFKHDRQQRNSELRRQSLCQKFTKCYRDIKHFSTSYCYRKVQIISSIFTLEIVSWGRFTTRYAGTVTHCDCRGHLSTLVRRPGLN